jgi:hypothetical protein
MVFVRPGFLTALLLLVVFLIPAGKAQSSASGDAFTIVVAPPTQATDVQVRYYFTGGGGGFGSSAADPVAGNKVLIKAGVEGQSAKSMKLIAYAPGCQFVILSVDDLAGTRQGDFQCQKLSTLPLQGRVDVLDFGQQQLQVEAYYMCRWAMPFFGVPAGAVSPLFLGKAAVASDGTFTLEVPDFINDSSWPRVSGDAGLMFALSDAKTGKRLATLTSLSDLKREGGGVPIASSYPELAFGIEQPQH